MYLVFKNMSFTGISSFPELFPNYSQCPMITENPVINWKRVGGMR